MPGGASGFSLLLIISSSRTVFHCKLQVVHKSKDTMPFIPQHTNILVYYLVAPHMSAQNCGQLS